MRGLIQCIKDLQILAVLPSMYIFMHFTLPTSSIGVSGVQASGANPPSLILSVATAWKPKSPCFAMQVSVAHTQNKCTENWRKEKLAISTRIATNIG